MKQLIKFIKGRMRLFDALRDMFAFFAVIHIFLTFVLAVTRNDWSYTNVFYIESASEFFPGIEKGIGNMIISAIIIVTVYLFFYLRRKSKS